MTTITERPQTFPPFVPQPWAVDALCAQVDSDLFYPEAGESNKVAKKLCSTCPVRVECLEYAMTTVQHFGIWGGLSAIEREADYLPLIVQRLSKPIEIVLDFGGVA